MNIMAVRRLFILNFQDGRQFWREPIGSFGEKWRAGRLGLQAAEFVGKASWNCLRIFSSAEEGREFRIILAKQEGREKKERELNKGK